jgi:hypothetical protein
MDTTDTDTSLLLVGLVVYLAGVMVILAALLLANWWAGRKRPRRERVTANPAAGRELVRVGYRVQRNYHRYR